MDKLLCKIYTKRPIYNLIPGKRVISGEYTTELYKQDIKYAMRDANVYAIIGDKEVLVEDIKDFDKLVYMVSSSKDEPSNNVDLNSMVDDIINKEPEKEVKKKKIEEVKEDKPEVVSEKVEEDVSETDTVEVKNKPEQNRRTPNRKK